MSAEIIHRLKKSGLSFYDLPWIMIFGPRGSGKSTLLAQSGLLFSWEYAESDSVRWLFSDKAIFIEVDFESENSVLSFLKKNRPKLPINGIWLVLSLKEIIAAQRVREKLANVIDALGYLFPVTTIFTHMDAVVGFDAFFQHQAPDIFPYRPNTFKKLNTHVLGLLSSQSAMESKFEIINFPEHFRRHQLVIDSMIDELTKNTPYHELPDFREVYFTAHHYFVKGIFQRICENYLGAAKKTRRLRGIGRWFTSLSLVIASILVLATFLIASASFARNTLRIQRGIHLGELTENASQGEDFMHLTDYLLSNPPAKLIPPLETILMNGLKQYVMPNKFAQVENQLALMQEQWALATSQEAEAMRGNYYNQLKLYLMFGEPHYRYAAFYQDDLIMAYYLNHSHKAWPIRPDYIQLSRQQLLLPSNSENVYAGFKAWGQKQLGDISASDLLSSSLDKSVTLPRFFTASGFSHYALPEIARLTKENAKSNWVMQSPHEILHDKLLSSYKSDYRQAWLVFLQNIRPAVGETVTEKTVRKIMAIAHQNILFKDTDSDPQVKLAIQNIQLLPQLTKIMAGIEASWQSSVFEFYRQHIAMKYPFYDSSDDVIPEDFQQFLGAVTKFAIQQGKSKWAYSQDYVKSMAVAQAMSTSFQFEIYPEPTLGLKEIRLMTNHQTYRYRNDPQEWQSMGWKLPEGADETSLEIMTSSGSVGSIEFESPWGLFRLFQKADLTPISEDEFRATWNIRADNGRNYRVDFLVKTGQGNNLLKMVLFETFRLPERVF